MRVKKVKMGYVEGSMKNDVDEINEKEINVVKSMK
jgi:hypothetical protein